MIGSVLGLRYSPFSPQTPLTRIPCLRSSFTAFLTCSVACKAWILIGLEFRNFTAYLACSATSKTTGIPKNWQLLVTMELFILSLRNLYLNIQISLLNRDHYPNGKYKSLKILIIMHLQFISPLTLPYEDPKTLRRTVTRPKVDNFEGRNLRYGVVSSTSA